MAWPSDQEYNEVVQNPAVAFSDEELRSGRIELNGMGLPKARSGNFATIYRVETQRGAYAIRCFRYDNPEQSRRYPAIVSYLNQNLLPYMVSFRFMSEGIRVGSKWYPTVKMKWVEGESLITYIERNLSSPSTIKDLADSWVEMVSDLHRIKVAHGDLQHGNVLVIRGKLKLVDYDGMYVPTLEGSRGLELGHRNYQHPQRTELDFGPQLDNFSAWLIYVSLIAVAAQPKLWKELNAGDECLLFRRADLEAPDQSARFRLLRAVPDKHIQTLTDQIEHLLWLPVDQIPTVTDLVSKSCAWKTTSFSPGGSWIEDYKCDFVDLAEDNQFAVIETGDPTWIHDHVDQQFMADSFINSAATDRLIALAISILAFAICGWISLATMRSASLAVWMIGFVSVSSAIAVCWLIRYRFDPVLKRLRSVKSDVNRTLAQSESAQRTFSNLKAKRLQRRNAYLADVSNVQKRQEGLQSDEAKRLDEVNTVLKMSLKQISDKRRLITAAEADEKRTLLDGIGAQITTLSKRLSSLSLQEQGELARLESEIGNKVKSLTDQVQQLVNRRDSELAAELRNYQDRVVNSHLQKIKISEATIPGIGPQLKQGLAAAGYVSAVDIGARYGRVPGIGSKKSAAIIAWRKKIEGPIRRREAPTSLKPDEKARIEQQYAIQIQQVQQDLAQEQTRLVRERQNLTTRIKEQRKHLEGQKAALEDCLRVQTLSIHKKFEDERKDLTDDEQRARQEFQKSTEDCRKHFQAMTTQLMQEIEKLRRDYNASLETLNQEIRDSAHIVRELSWKREMAVRKCQAYAHLSFKTYALRVLGRT